MPSSPVVRHRFWAGVTKIAARSPAGVSASWLAMSALGIDIGGSKVVVGLIDGAGRVIRRLRAPTPAREGRGAILQTVLDLADEVVADEAPTNIGIGSAGVIDGGRVVAATSLLTNWVGTDLVGHFTERWSRPGEHPHVVAVNDVHAHGVGEAWCGAGAGRDWVLVVAVGTGLGGVVVQKRKPNLGAHGVAGHLGHITSAAAADLPCSCGAIGHLEAVASGYGVVQLYHALGGDPSITDAQAIMTRTARDKVAAETVRISARALGTALGGLINVIDPGIVIMSGGLANAGSEWWKHLREAAADEVLPLVAGTGIVQAALGADAGMVGAAGYALQTGQVGL